MDVVRRVLWGAVAVCVAVLFVGAVLSVVRDATAPDRSPDNAKAGDCIGFADDSRLPQDPSSARLSPCDDPDAVYRVLGDGDLHRRLNGGDACAAYEDTMKALVIGPKAPTFGRIICLDKIDRD